MATFVSPGVYVVEQDFSLYIPNLSTTILGMVGAAQKGPLNEATQITSAVEFIQTFGEPSPSMFGPYAALQFLQEGSTMYYTRVAGEDAFTALLQIPSAEAGGSDVAAAITSTLSGPFVITGLNDQLVITEIDYSSGSYATVDRTISLTHSTGPIATQSLGVGGLGYAVGDTGTVNTGGADAAYSVLSTASPDYTITGVDQGTKTFSIAGDHAFEFQAGDTVNVNGSTGNDGSYTVVSASFTVTTDIIVVEAIPNATADGTITPSRGAVVTFSITSPGTGYSVASGVATTDGGGQPGVGVGFTINILTISAVARTVAQVVSDITGTGGYASFNFTAAAISGPFIQLTHKLKSNQKGLKIKSGVANTAATILGFDLLEHYGSDVKSLPATISGSVTGTVAITGSNNDLVINEVDLRGGTPAIITARPVALTTGATQSMQDVADDINTAARAGAWNIEAAVSGGALILTTATIENELFGLSISSVGESGLAATLLGLNDTEVFYGAKAKWLVQAVNEGAWGNDISVTLLDGSIASTYKIDVYYLQTKVETFDKLSTNPADDTFVEKVINGVSNYITVTDNAALGLPPDLAFSTLSTPPGVNLGFGNDDLAGLSDNEYIGIIDPAGAATGLQVYANPEVINVNLIAIPGVSSGAVINAEIALCADRGDCMAIIDPPFGLSSQNVIKWHNGVAPYDDHQAFDSSYAALYWPWIQIFDPVNNQKVWTPPSGHLARVYGFTDRTTETWYAPAGTQRGHIIPALKVEHSATRGERDLMYGNGNAINPIINIPQTGITVWGQRTLQRASTARDRVNVRRLLLYLEKVIATASQFLVFEPNDTILWAQFVDLVTPFCDSVKARRGLYDFAVRCDQTTNPPDAVDRNEMHAYILLKPTKTAEQIIITFTLTTTGANFNEIASF